MKIPMDAGPLITLVETCYCWILEKLSRRREFVVPPVVYEEIITNPLTIMRHKLSALRMRDLVNKGIVKVERVEGLDRETNYFMSLANNLYFSKGKALRIIHRGEAQVVALAKLLGSPAIVVDERTLRLILEDPIALRNLLEKEVGDIVSVNSGVLKKIREEYRLEVMRSAELLALAMEAGILKMDREWFEAALYALKFNGCSITRREIEEYVTLV